MNIVLNVIGILVLLVCIYALSYNRKAINKKLVLKAFVCQILLTFIVIKVPAGVWVIEKISDFVTQILGYGRYGLEFVFGSLINPNGAAGFIFMVQVLGNIIFVGALVSLLNYCGVLGFVVDIIGKAVGKLIGTSKVETFISVANMFLGQTESPLLVSKYLGKMTRSEIFMVLVAGMASMSVSILGGYNALGVQMTFLIIASAMVPFGSILVGKIILPEMEDVKEVGDIKVDRKTAGSNAVEALSNGAMDGIQMVIAIAASLVGIIAVVSMINGGLGVVGLQLQEILGWIFYPIAFLMGLGDFTQLGAQMLGCKLALNEFIAFDMMVKASAGMDYRTLAMLSVGIAGFANVSSMAICLSGLGTLCPEKKPVVAQLVGRALAGSFLLNIMNAMIVGIFASF